MAKGPQRDMLAARRDWPVPVVGCAAAVAIVVECLRRLPHPTLPTVAIGLFLMATVLLWGQARTQASRGSGQPRLPVLALFVASLLVSVGDLYLHTTNLGVLSARDSKYVLVAVLVLGPLLAGLAKRS